MFWKIVKFIVKWGLIAFALYVGFWLTLTVLIGFLLFGGLMSEIQTATAPSGGRTYDQYNDRFY